MQGPKSSFTRRQFMASTAAGASLVHATSLAGQSSGATANWNSPAVVRKAYLSGTHAGWPHPGFDLQADIRKIEAHLAELERRYPGRIRFTGGEVLHNADEAAAWNATSGGADAVLAFNMTTGRYPTLEKVVSAGRPVLLFALPYTGHDWSHCSAFTQMGMKADVIASSDFAELDPYVDVFQTIHHLRNSKVLVVGPEKTRPSGQNYHDHFGTNFAFPSYLDVKAAYEAADSKEAERLADEFIRNAAKVVEPPRAEIVDSMRLYLGILQMMKQENANAITIDCLGGFGRKQLPAYPCIAFSKLNDVGQYGVCECDLESTMTQLLVTSFSGKPGFVSDPVFDTSRNEVIHAHCVSATAMDGVGTPGSPYMVRTHLEDHKGVSMQVLVNTEGPVTVARFSGPDKLLIATAEATGNVDDESGCRTKIRTKVTDARKYLRNWGLVRISGVKPSSTRDLLHRVVFYGDHVEMVERIGRLTGFEVLHEL